MILLKISILIFIDKFTYYDNLLLYMDMSSCCSNCGRKTQDYPIFCHMCNDYYCSEKCHFEKHKLQYQKFWMEIRKLEKREVLTNNNFLTYKMISIN
jgi:hypothetical protein